MGIKGLKGPGLLVPAGYSGTIAGKHGRNFQSAPACRPGQGTPVSGLMELIEAVLAVLCGLGDLLTLVLDIYCWLAGRENRLERKEARKAGEVPPARDKWNRRVIWLTILFMAVTAGFFWISAGVPEAMTRMVAPVSYPVAAMWPGGYNAWSKTGVP